MVGAFPPPMHGMAAVNQAVHNALQKASAAPVVIDIAASSLNRSIIARLGRFPRVLRGMSRFVRMRALRGKSLYISVSGGFGQIYELVFVLLARLRGMRLFLHHHSFAYLGRPNALTRALICAAGDDAVHIVLSPGMAERLRRNYRVTKVVPVSNAVFFASSEASGREPRQLTTVGYLSNISAEKGIFEFLDLMAAAEESGLPLCALLAGPFEDMETERAVRTRLATLQHVEYVGPQYGADKNAFYAWIDALIFPTRYNNEAEPVTVHEAMSRGMPVVAYGRGSIPEIINADGGLVIDPSDAFVPAALDQLGRWVEDPAAFSAVSKAAARRFATTYDENKARWNALLSELVGRCVKTDIPGEVRS